MKRIEKQRKLYQKAYNLRKIAYMGQSYEKQMEIRANQDKVYKQWLFYKNLGIAMEKVKL